MLELASFYCLFNRLQWTYCKIVVLKVLLSFLTHCPFVSMLSPILPTQPCASAVLAIALSLAVCVCLSQTTVLSIQLVLV